MRQSATDCKMNETTSLNQSERRLVADLIKLFDATVDSGRCRRDCNCPTCRAMEEAGGHTVSTFDSLKNKVETGADSLPGSGSFRPATDAERGAVGSSELAIPLSELVSSVNAFMAACDANGVKIPFLPCEVLMWDLKSKVSHAEKALSRRKKILPPRNLNSVSEEEAV